jgi:signal transduction histidine kinase
MNPEIELSARLSGFFGSIPVSYAMSRIRAGLPSKHRREAQKALLDLFSSATGLPIGLYDFQDGNLEAVFSQMSLSNFEPHCQFIQQFPGGKALCRGDQCNRATTVFDDPEERLTLCYAGLYNQAVPIKVNAEIQAVILYGEMQIEGKSYQEKSLEKHQQAITRLGLSESDASRLRDLLLDAKKYTPERLEEIKMVFPKVEEWFYVLMDEEDRLKAGVDRVTHDMQTRLQAIIANAENLVLELPMISIAESQKMAREVLFSALALDTLVQNLGHYLEDYDFRKRSIGPLIFEARRVYQAEAARRGIDIRIRLKEPREHPVEISRSHMQHALNNLVHNAVKYSYRSGYGRERFVKIEGYPQKRAYVIEIKNYGVGILPEEIDSGAIYRDGYQGKLTQGEYRTGSGKGLSFAHAVIQQHHGSIEVESRLLSDKIEPEGEPHLTRFTVRLPYKQPQE